MQDELPVVCPKCGSREVESEMESDDKANDYADQWFEYYCRKCGYQWKTEKEYGYG